MFRKVIEQNQQISSNGYQIQFNFNLEVSRNDVKEDIADFTSTVLDSLMNKAKLLYVDRLHSAVFFFIKEALKNSYDSCYDRFLAFGGQDYRADILWDYSRPTLSITVVDNGMGLNASRSGKKKLNNNIYLGGEGQGLEVSRALFIEVENTYGFFTHMQDKREKLPRGGAMYTVKIRASR